MSVMVPVQLKFIEGYTYSLLLELVGSPALEGPYMLTVSAGSTP